MLDETIPIWQFNPHIFQPVSFNYTFLVTCLCQYSLLPTLPVNINSSSSSEIERKATNKTCNMSLSFIERSNVPLALNTRMSHTRGTSSLRIGLICRWVRGGSAEWHRRQKTRMKEDKQRQGNVAEALLILLTWCLLDLTVSKLSLVRKENYSSGYSVVSVVGRGIFLPCVGGAEGNCIRSRWLSLSMMLMRGTVEKDLMSQDRRGES